MREPAIEIRWMQLGRDLPEVLVIELRSFGDGRWDAEEFECYLRNRGCFAMVAIYGGDVVGYIVYKRMKIRELWLLNLAVHPDHRRRGVARRLIEALKEKLRPERRTRIVEKVRETNLAAQLFFRSQGFRAVGVERRAFEDTGEAAYVMEYRCVGNVPRNRIGHLIGGI